jgi:hypothetical protein
MEQHNSNRRTLYLKGEDGVGKVLDILNEELRLTMALCGKLEPFLLCQPFLISNTLGCPTIQSISQDNIVLEDMCRL